MELKLQAQGVPRGFKPRRSPTELVRLPDKRTNFCASACSFGAVSGPLIYKRCHILQGRSEDPP